MRDILQPLLTASVFVFTVSSMLAVGFSYTVLQIFGPLRHPTAVLRAVVANFLLVPLLALAITRLLPLDPAIAVAVILLGCGAGAPFLIKLTQAAEGDLALSAALLVLLVPFTVVYMPLVVPLMVPEAPVDAGVIAQQLALTLLVPFAIGLVIHERATRWAHRLRPVMSTVSTTALIMLVTTTILLNFREIVGLGFIAFVAALLLILGAFAIGYLVARPGRSRRTVLALGTGQRNIAASTLVASQDLEQQTTLVMVVLTSVVGIFVLFPLARWLRGRAARGVAPPTAAGFAGARA